MAIDMPTTSSDAIGKMMTDRRRTKPRIALSPAPPAKMASASGVLRRPVGELMLVKHPKTMMIAPSAIGMAAINLAGSFTARAAEIDIRSTASAITTQMILILRTNYSCMTGEPSTTAAEAGLNSLGLM
jgi:hypothetical protein